MFVKGGELDKVSKVHKHTNGNEEVQGNHTSDNANNVALHSLVIVPCHLFQFGNTLAKAMVSN